jgi:hypothetical protein
MKTRKKVTIEHCGFTVTADTATQARAEAEAKATAAMNADYTPRVIQGANRLAIIWRTPTGICSAYLKDTSERIRGFCCHTSTDQMDAVENVCRLNMARDGDSDSDELPAILLPCPPYIHAEFWSWVGFQRAFRRHKQEHPDARYEVHHEWACNHGHEFRPDRKEAVAA